MDAGGLGGFFDLGMRRAGLAVSDVVFHRVVEQHRVLRHDANRLAHRRLRDLLDVLPGYRDAALLHIVKAVQQPRQRRFSRARGADNGHGFSRRNLKTDVVQNWAAWVVGKADVFKTHGGVQRAVQPASTLPVIQSAVQRAALPAVEPVIQSAALPARLQRANDQRQRARHVGNLALLFHQREHLVQVGQALLDLAVDHAQKTQRNVELDHEGVDHHQIAQRHARLDHALRGAPEHGDQPQRNDELLA